MSIPKKRMVAGGLLLAVGLYFGYAAYFVHFAADSHLVGHGKDFPSGYADSTLTFPAANGSALTVRASGTGVGGCVVYFPGNSGPSQRYEDAVVPRLHEHGVAVYLVTYPGQEKGAVSVAPFHEVIALSRTALTAVATRCEGRKLVVAGISLGAMVAAYAAPAVHTDALLLTSASPSLSMATRAQIKLQWFARPWGLLPIERLLVDDYSINTALADSHIPRVVIFQGTKDTLTPLADLQKPGAIPPGIELVTVSGAEHGTAVHIGLDRYLQLLLGMLR